MNIALISPNQDAFSETFIQAHKKGLEGNVLFYYGDSFPTNLEGYGMFPSTLGDFSSYLLKKIYSKNIQSDHFKERGLMRSFKKNKIDIVYAEYGTTGVAVLNICKSMSIPLVVNFHGYDISIDKIIEEYKEAYQSLFQYASAIIAVSKKMIDDLVALGCPREKIHYTPCAPNDVFFSFTPTYSENSFISVGRFTEKKAPYYTILAFNEVLKHYPQALLYMVGGGELYSICQNIIKHLGIEENVKLLGVCKHNELQKYFERVKAFLQHSIVAENGDSEGTPVAVLEASAAALPVISTKHAGINDVVIDDKTGYLVEEHDTKVMADKILLLLNESNKCKELGEEGRRFIKENFSMKKHLELLNDILKNSLNSRINQ